MNGDIELEAMGPTRDPSSGEALPERSQPGYYPGFSSYAQQPYWDEATRAVIVARVENPPAIEYFDAAEARFWTAVFAHLIPQTDRSPDRRIPVLNMVDRRLSRNDTAGYRFADMPPDREAYRLGREAIDAESQTIGGKDFIELPIASQDAVLRVLHDGKPRAAEDIWRRMSVHRFWQLLIGDAADAYYAHPWAWDEIGFGGPAYPRAYMRLERGDPEPWEVRESRYDWADPADVSSGLVENVHEFHLESEQHRAHAGDGRSQ